MFASNKELATNLIVLAAILLAIPFLPQGQPCPHNLTRSIPTVPSVK